MDMINKEADERPTLGKNPDSVCECLFCESQKMGREFTEFHRDWVNDNSQYGTKNKFCADCSEFEPDGIAKPDTVSGGLSTMTRGERREHYRAHEKALPETVPDFAHEVDFLASESKPYELRLDDWTDLDYRTWACWDELNDTMSLLDLAERHSSPQVMRGAESKKPRGNPAGFLNVTEHDHERVVSWSPNVATYRPPVVEGQRHTTYVSQKTRRRICRVGDWMRWKHTSLGFLTLTYREAKCDKEAKRDLDVLLKRIARADRCRLYDHLWCAERTKRGVVHFHLFFAGFIPKEWVNQAWSEILGYTAYPNIKKAHQASVGYIVKYMSKDDRCPIAGRRWGASARALRESLPTDTTRIEMTWAEFIDLTAQVPDSSMDVVYKNGFLTKKDPK